MSKFAFKAHTKILSVCLFALHFYSTFFSTIQSLMTRINEIVRTKNCVSAELHAIRKTPNAFIAPHCKIASFVQIKYLRVKKATFFC